MTTSLPQFTNINIEKFPTTLDELLTKHLAEIDSLLTQKDFTWDNLMYPLESMEDELEVLWSPFSHLHAVVNSDELRKCYKLCLPKLSAYESAIGQNIDLYNAICSIDKSLLDSVQKKIIDDSVRGFKLSGVTLVDAKKKRFEEIQAELSELSNQFDNNLLDATQAYELPITDEEKLRGLPEHALSAAKELAATKGLPGWTLNLETPCYLAVVTYADDRNLREEFYRAYVTRASDEGPFAGKFDNSDVMNNIMKLRDEKAKLLGFGSYAELSIAPKMAESTNQVTDFLTDLCKRAYGQAEDEFVELKNFASKHYSIEQVEPWDISYLSEKKQQKEFSVSQEMLRPYFPLPKVMSGLYAIINKLYGMHMEEVEDFDSWHDDVTCYRVIDDKNELRGLVYIDLFARQNKRGGAWMDGCQSRRKLKDGTVLTPIAMLTCNFAKPVAGQVATLSHDEVITLFHEFGHCLHHVLTKVDYSSASGTHGVEWDAVELPSQFFENWCWEEEALALLTRHVKTGEQLSKALFDQVIAAKNFQSAMVMMRQLEFSLFDFRIHQEYDANIFNFIQSVLDDVRSKTAVVPIASYNRFQHGFSHIFAGGYAAGYYSYKWAEVLSSDAFSRFEDEGIFNAKTGRDFLHNILEVGGSVKASVAFEKFRGRQANVEALLKHNGIMS